MRLAELPGVDAVVISHDHYVFDLALHGWTEPMERVLVAADSQGVRVASPRPGGMVEPAALAPVTRWWPRLPWETAAQAPVWSTGVEHLLGR